MQKLGVVGAGTMGSGIAQKIATEGLPVVLIDQTEAFVEKGMERIRSTLEQGVARKLFRAEQVPQILGRIEATADLTRAKECDLVIEAVFEDRKVKLDLFRRLEGVLRPDALLATNTSSFTVTELAEAVAHPGRVVGLHFFFHPAKNRLVEVIAGRKTDAASFDSAWAFCERIGKTPIRSADASGFVVNRFFVPWMNEAVRMLDEGVADLPTIESAAKEAFGIGMGPFELMNVTGVPIGLHAAETLGEAFGPFYAPSRALARQVESKKNWDLAGSPSGKGAEAVRERLLSATFLIAAHLVEEGVATLEDTDVGARVALRWPKGPFELANALGVEKAAALAGALARRHGLKPPALLDRQGASRRPFRFIVVRTEKRPSFAQVVLNRPDALNALDPELIAQLEEAWEVLRQDAPVRGVVLSGRGKAFVAGADIKFFLRAMEKGDLAPVRAFTERASRLYASLDASPQPVVCRLDGLSLGGGSELALACDRIIATERGTIGFPETGIGIYPGLGGTQRLPRRVGIGLAKYLILTGRVLDARTAQSIGLVDRVVGPDGMEAALSEAIVSGARPADAKPAVPSGPFAKFASFFERTRVDDILAGRTDAKDDADLERAVKSVQKRAPLALRLAERLIEEGMKVSLEEGLRMELSHLEEVFRSQDARAGLASVVGGPPPVWQGR